VAIASIRRSEYSYFMRHVIRRHASLVCIAGFSSLALQPVHAQDAPPVFQTTTELVLLDIQVLHKRTHTPAPSLQAKDLHVFEDGVPQEIRQFSRDEAPLSVVLLFDLTLTVRPVLKHLAEGANGALTHFKPTDEVSVMAYSDSAQVVDDFTTDRERTARAISQAAQMTYEGNAYFNEAMYRAATQLHQAKVPSSRRAVIWLTDGAPDVPFHTRNPVHSEVEAFRALHQEGVVALSTLMEDPKMIPVYLFMSAIEGPFAKSHPPGDAKKYAELTGGQSLNLRRKKSGDLLAELIDELRARYTIGYRPSASKPAGTFCKLHVELAPDGPLRSNEWVVSARQGYYRR
jgi:VWFA-related protein